MNQAQLNKQTQEWVRMQNHPMLGKVLGYSMSTERWRDRVPTMFSKLWWWMVLRGRFDNGRFTDNPQSVIRPGDPDYDPTPYEVTHIL